MIIFDELLEEGIPARTLLKQLLLPPSSYYYKAKDTKQGKKPLDFVLDKNGERTTIKKVIEDIETLLSGEFVDYGYYKVYRHLKYNIGYQIGSSKTYKIMKTNSLLKFQRANTKKGYKNWVKELVPSPTTEFTFLEFDIKYMYVAGKRTNIQVLTVIDVYSRWVLDQHIAWKISQHDVIALFKRLLDQYPKAKNFTVRNDNGSQFEATLVQDYLKGQGITQEFTKPATPQQNAHIESYHSILESAVCRRMEFEDLNHTVEVMERFKQFYNFERIHGGLNYLSPYKYLLQQGTDMKSALVLKSA